jgi:hypothetical protein
MVDLRLCLAACSTLALTLLAVPASDQPAGKNAASIAAADIAMPPNLPSIGRWMIDKDGSAAHWLGELVDGKQLHEPINVILIDAVSSSSAEARQNLLAAAASAGYPVRFGHSTGYRGLIGNALYSQLPNRRDDAFSNHVFEETNNHGRIFGPHEFNGTYVFTGAFSRESVNFLHDPVHRYASFNEARDDFARALAAHTSFQPAGTAPLDNAIPDNPKFTTGDHDGQAVVLQMGSRGLEPAQKR